MDSTVLDIRTGRRALQNLGAYLRYSTLFRREVFKKQGMRFGLH